MLDVGGQGCKVVQQNEGLVLKFEMNDKCAAAKPILEEMVHCEVFVSDEPQMPASLGVVLMARDDYFASL